MNDPQLDALFAPMDADDGSNHHLPLERMPPHNFEAEAALLGAILNNNAAYERVSDILRPEHFADARHGRIFEACGKLIERGQLANPVTLSAFFRQDEHLAEIGGAQYLAELSNNMVSVINAGDYGKLVYDLYLRRELIDIGESVVNEAYQYELEADAGNQIENAEQRLFSLATAGAAESGFIGFGAALTRAVENVEHAYKNAGKVVGVTTGLRDIDRKLGGLHPSDLLILAGRPSMGKTALAMNVAFNAAISSHKTRASGEDQFDELRTGAIAVFSLEMAAEQLAGRLLSQAAEVSGDNMRRGDLNEDDFERLVIASRELNTVPLYIDDTPALPVSTLRTRCRRLKRQHGLAMIVVDYLQLLAPPTNFRGDGRVQEVSEITRSLKAIAKELGCPVLALSQLSRAVEQRDDKRPQLSDLRESGSIEQDADVVMFIYREQYYLERAEPAQKPEESTDKFGERYSQWQDRLNQVYNTAEVIVAKQRHGPVGNVRLFFDGNFTKFGDLDHIAEDLDE
ncbi:replicative DNA helicase [uncultured Thalassospira sp.]|mgnify:CR=1 FL=1|jgi:replicative DNA helicase|uniref:replicative DNA helicase n=1 Tax=uncultured Thalassospira sp. TaxID=404382 RepID=UPI0030DCFF63|tara:strand:+ start:2621 stop:4162 length:1542 start_codon:yes stop_codon:yes gene_type:complete